MNSTNKAAIERNWRWRASPSLSLTDTWPGSLGLIQGRGAGVYRCLAVNLHGSCRFHPELPEWLSKPNSGGLQLWLLMFILPGPRLRSIATQIPFWRLGEKYFPKQTDWEQNKQPGLGVHMASEESHLSQAQSPWEMIGKCGDPRRESVPNCAKGKYKLPPRGMDNSNSIDTYLWNI